MSSYTEYVDRYVNIEVNSQSIEFIESSAATSFSNDLQTARSQFIENGGVWSRVISAADTAPFEVINNVQKLQIRTFCFSSYLRIIDIFKIYLNII